MVFCGVFSAIAFVLYLIELPILPPAPHLKLDFSDIPALVGAVFFGPVFGIIVELVKNLIEFQIRGMSAQLGIGNLMNFLVGSAYIVPFSLLYNKFVGKANINKVTSNGINKIKSMSIVKVIIISSLISLISMVIMGIATNYFATPLFFKLFMQEEIPNNVLWTFIGWSTVMNVIKGAILSVVIYPLIKIFSKVKVI